MTRAACQQDICYWCWHWIDQDEEDDPTKAYCCKHNEFTDYNGFCGDYTSCFAKGRKGARKPGSFGICDG